MFANFTMFSDFVNIKPYGNNNFIMLLLSQIAFKLFPTSELSSQRTSLKYLFGFLKF